MKRLRLAIRLSALGDLVLASAFVEKALALYPDDELLLISSKEFQKFVREFFPPKLLTLAVQKEESLWGLFRQGFRMGQKYSRSSLYRVVELFDLHGVAKSSAFLWGFRLAFGLKFQWLPVRHYRKHSLLRQLSIWRHRDLLGKRFVYQDYQRTLGVESDFSRPHLQVSPSEDSRKNFIVFAPEASQWKKKWPSEYWVELLEKTLKTFPHEIVALVGFDSSLDGGRLRQLEKAFPNRIANFLGKTSIEDLPHILAQAKLTLCQNSSIQHISESLGVPVLSLAGPIVTGFGFSPFLTESVEFAKALACRPCSKHGGGPCILKGDDYHACMRQITPGEVQAAVAQRLKVASGGPPQ